MTIAKRTRRNAAAVLALFVWGCNGESESNGASGGAGDGGASTNGGTGNADTGGSSTSGAGGGDGGVSSTNGGSGTGGAAGEALTSENYARRLAETHCESIEACCGAEDFEFDRASCVETLEGLLAPAVRATLENPNIVFDTDAAVRCLETYRTAVSACDDRDLAQTIDQPCEEIFRGTLPEGSRCDDDGECAQPSTGTILCDDDDVCRRAEDDPGGGGSSRAGLGEPCRESCTEGVSWSSCSAPVSGATSNGTCFAEDDLYCSPEAVCEPAPSVDDPCPSGACDGASYCSGGTCVPRTETGSCDIGYECVSTSRCESETCVPNAANGEACQRAIECQSVHCAGGICRDWSLATPETCAGRALAGAY